MTFFLESSAHPPVLSFRKELGRDKSSICASYLRRAQFDAVKEIQKLPLVVFFIFYRYTINYWIAYHPGSRIAPHWDSCIHVYVQYIHTVVHTAKLTYFKAPQPVATCGGQAGSARQRILHVQLDSTWTYSCTQEANVRECSWTGTVGIQRVEVSVHFLMVTALISDNYF